VQSSVVGTVNRTSHLALRLAVTVLAGALLCSSLVVAMAPAAWGALNAHSQVPVRLGQFSGLAQRSVIFDVTGEQIGVFQVENTQRTPVSSVPDQVIAAFLAVEDSTYFSHKGVNLRATVRALLANYQSSATRQGASTATAGTRSCRPATR
jgi:penicillin-binding protein 1A